MKNFWKAIRESAHLTPIILLATICSAGIALLWGSNIGALYPVIEITLRNESMQSWLQKKSDGIHKEIDELQSQRSVIEKDSELEDSQKDKNLQSIDSSIKEKQESLSWNEWQLAWATKIMPKDAFQTICMIMGVLVVSTLVKHILMLTSDLLLGYASTTIVRSIRQRVFDKALQMDKLSYQNYGTSGLLSSITTAADGLSAGLMAVFGVAIREPLRVISCLALACFISWRLLLLSVVLAPLLVIVIVYFNKKIRSIASSILGRNAGFHEVMLEALSNVFTVQAFTMEKHEKQRFAASTRDMQKVSLRMIFYSGLSKPFTELIGVGMVAITACAGAYLVVNKETHLFYMQIRETPLTVTDLLIFFGLLVGASDPLRKMSGVSILIYNGAMAATALYGIIESKSVIEEPEEPKLLPTRTNDLVIEGVDFHYHEKHPILKSMNLTVPFGKTIAILGPNGSGKSTLIQLLCRYYDPARGSISLGETNIKEMSLTDLRGRIALVSQSTELFNRSVIENIRYGTPEATDEQVIEASKKAFAHKFITESLSNGYDTIVGQGGQKLSGGQRQRIALARAILRKPEILLLDESTSQIDMASEVQIRNTLAIMKGEMTIIIITHREALTAIADDIYMMNEGRLVSVQETAEAA